MLVMEMTSMVNLYMKEMTFERSQSCFGVCGHGEFIFEGFSPIRALEGAETTPVTPMTDCLNLEHTER